MLKNLEKLCYQTYFSISRAFQYGLKNELPKAESAVESHQLSDFNIKLQILIQHREERMESFTLVSMKSKWYFRMVELQGP